MTNKRIVRFLKRYTIGLFIFYVFVAVFAYIRLTTANDLKDYKAIPQFQIENHFGELTSFESYKGKVLLVDFWFQGCKPCLEEMKYFPQLLAENKDEIAIMSISIDGKSATRELLKQKPKPWDFLLSQNQNWTFYNDNRLDSSYVSELNISQYPTYLLFNKDGEFINTPFSGIAGVENELSGVLGFDVTYNLIRENISKIITLLVPFNCIVLLLLILQFLIVWIKKIVKKQDV